MLKVVVGLGRFLVILLAVVTGAGAAEFQVNQYTTSTQALPKISHDSSGGFVVAWTSDLQDGSGYGVFVRRFDSSGGALGAERQVNQFTMSHQSSPSVSHDSLGRFVVVWESSQDGLGLGVFERPFTSLGNPIGAEFQVNQYTTNDQSLPAISHDASGRFAVVWRSSGQDGFGFGIFARRFNSSGAVVGAEFQVNQYTMNDQKFPAISHNSAGGFVVAWQSTGEDGSFDGVFARRFNSSGTALGPEFQVSEFTSNNQRTPAISHDSTGGFAVAWQSQIGGSFEGVFGRRFNSSGGALGGEFQVYQMNSGHGYPAISHNISGGFAVAWQSYIQVDQRWDVFARRFNRFGDALGDEFQVNQHTLRNQLFPAISHDSAANFVVAWQSYLQDGSQGYGVFATVIPSALVATGPAVGGGSLVRRHQKD